MEIRIWWLRICTLFFLAIAKASASCAAEEPPANSFYEAGVLRGLVNNPEHDLSFAQHKLTIDALIDRGIEPAVEMDKIDAIVRTIKAMLPEDPTSHDKLLAIRRYLYEPGEWNDNTPYSYDFADPMGRNIASKLLSTYLVSKRGNCVTMPFLFLILGEQLGIDVRAAIAPQHIFVKYTDGVTGLTINLETTSGANPARDEWYRQQIPMTDTAIANGLYLRQLSKKESIVVMMTVLAEYYAANGKHEKAIVVSDIQLEHFPNYDTPMLRKGASYYLILRERFVQKYPNPKLIPTAEQKDFRLLSMQNLYWYEKAESLGWREPSMEHEERYLSTVTRDARNDEYVNGHSSVR